MGNADAVQRTSLDFERGMYKDVGEARRADVCIHSRHGTTLATGSSGEPWLL